MKKAAAILMALALIVGSAISAFASTVVVTPDDKGGNTEITFMIDNTPSYSVSIPQAIHMDSWDGADMVVKAENVTLNDNQKISVTLAGTSYHADQLIMASPDGNSIVRYGLKLPNGEYWENTGNYPYTNQEMISFTEDKAETIKITPVWTYGWEKDVTYKSILTFGIGLVEA